jgi:hypothetical protein
MSRSASAGPARQQLTLLPFELLHQSLARRQLSGELGFALEEPASGRILQLMHQSRTPPLLIQQRQLLVEGLFPAVEFGRLRSQVFGDLAGLQQQLIVGARSAWRIADS